MTQTTRRGEERGGRSFTEDGAEAADGEGAEEAARLRQHLA